MKPRCVVQRGVALAEWTLAALLGVILLAAALAWLQAALQLALAQRQPQQMAEEAGWLLGRLGQAAALAGQGGVHPLGSGDSRLSSWRISEASGPGTPASDQLLLRRLLADEVLDCEGVRLGAGAELVERYFLRADSSTPGLVLACDAGACDAAGCHGLGDAGVALLSEVESFQVLYGLSTTAGMPVRYVDATVWQAQPLPARLSSLRIGLLLRSRELSPRARRWAMPADWLGLTLVAATGRTARSAWQQTLGVPHG